MFYEVIFEDGSFSVAEYESDEEAVAACEAHHQRALAGGRSLESAPNSPPASRIAKLLKYENHPQDETESQALPVAEVEKAVKQALKDHAHGDLVSVPQIAASVRDLTSPLVVSEPHESNFKAKEVGEVEGAWKD